jgi:hypothetical protein
MGPYGDRERPRVGAVTFERGGRAIGRVLSGTIDVVVEVHDAPALPVPLPWSQVQLTPALVRWRIVDRGQQAASAWLTAFDTREALPSTRFSSVYAAGTRQNRGHRVGRYRFYLVHAFNTSVLGRSAYELQVSALDIRGNEMVKSVPFAIGAL